jgi:hypothetical protein
MRKLALIGAVVMGGVMLSAAPVSVQWSPEKALAVSVDKAYARVGRPATPGSVAGVHRRQTRRVVRHSRRAVRRCAAGVTCY